MTTNVIGAGFSGGHARSSTSRYARSGPASARYGDSTTTSGTSGTWRSHRLRSAAAAAGSSLMYTARTSSAMDRATLAAWTTARFNAGMGTTTRSSRWGIGTTTSSRIASARAAAEYWRLMKTMIATSVGMRITTRYAPEVNFTLATTMRTTNVRTAPKPFTAARHHQPCSRSRRQWRTMPNWLRGKQTNTPTE